MSRVVAAGGGPGRGQRLGQRPGKELHPDPVAGCRQERGQSQTLSVQEPGYLAGRHDAQVDHDTVDLVDGLGGAVIVIAAAGDDQVVVRTLVVPQERRVVLQRLQADLTRSGHLIEDLQSTAQDVGDQPPRGGCLMVELVTDRLAE